MPLSIIICSFSLSAQVSIGITLEKKEFIQYEPVLVEIEIINRSGDHLNFETDPESFIIEITKGSYSRIDRSDKEWKLPINNISNGENVKIEINLTPYFQIWKPSSYSISVRIKYPESNIDVRTRSKMFNIVSGRIISDQIIGMPTDKSKKRRYSVIAKREIDQELAYVRVSEPDMSSIYAVYHIGNLVDSNDVTTGLDPRNNFHILLHHSPRVYRYYMINPEGEITKISHISSHAHRPKLVKNLNGDIEVIGGQILSSVNK